MAMSLCQSFWQHSPFCPNTLGCGRCRCIIRHEHGGSSSCRTIGTGNVPLPTAEQLPNDLDTLKRMIVELVTTLHRERRDKDALRHRVDLLLQRLYGPRTERVDPNQLLLFADGLMPEPDAADASAAARPARRSARRPRSGAAGRMAAASLPQDLPRRPLHHELSEAERICRLRPGCASTSARDVSEQLDWQPASLFVWQHWVHKYVCPALCQASDRGRHDPSGSTPPADHEPQRRGNGRRRRPRSTTPPTRRRAARPPRPGGDRGRPSRPCPSPRDCPGRACWPT